MYENQAIHSVPDAAEWSWGKIGWGGGWLPGMVVRWRKHKRLLPFSICAWNRNKNVFLYKHIYEIYIFWGKKIFSFYYYRPLPWCLPQNVIWFCIILSSRSWLVAQGRYFKSWSFVRFSFCNCQIEYSFIICLSFSCQNIKVSSEVKVKLKSFRNQVIYSFDKIIKRSL